MKVCVIQPYYSFDGKDTEYCFNEMIKLMDACDDSMDIIVLPEYSDIPAAQKNRADMMASVRERNGIIMNKAIELAKRCNSIVFVNAAHDEGYGYRNTTHAIDRNGNIVGRYFKAHPAPSEFRKTGVSGEDFDVDYSYEGSEPTVIEIEGIRFGFMTCYDFYFYENFAQLARKNIDIIIGCSHQRTDTHEALSIINRFLSYQTNAYLLRSSVSLGEDSGICGCSCIIAPDGKTLVDMKSRVGLGVYEINPKEKYYKPAGFRGKMKAHYEYIEEGRKPWLYRNGGASVVRFDEDMPYPRICAHRGFNTVAPENSMPAFGAAVALGANEIEFDLWSTKDGVLVSCHDSTLDRVSDGTGNIWDYTYEELLSFDFGAKHGEKFKGLKIATFEEILKKLASRVIMNIHVKIWDNADNDDKIEEIVALIRKYDCEKHIYFMTSNDRAAKKVMEYAPDLKLCLGWNGDKNPMSLVDRAIELGAYKIQLFKPYFTQETIDKAHEHGILCNLFWADEPDEARKFLDMGVDCILTNDYLSIYNAVKDKIR